MSDKAARCPAWDASAWNCGPIAGARGRMRAGEETLAFLSSERALMHMDACARLAMWVNAELQIAEAQAALAWFEAQGVVDEPRGPASSAQRAFWEHALHEHRRRS